MADSSSSSSAAPAKSDVEMEELLERMLTRLALCDNSKLEALLSKLLPLAISFLSTQSQAVRNKVIEILSHVNKRVKHQTEIGLPLSELWKMYNEATALMVKNFSIVYIEMAFDRENMKGKEGMGPILLANISKLSHQHQDIILRIATKVIGECHINQIDSKVGAKYRLLTDFQDRDVFLEFCLHTILFQLPAQGGACSAGLSVGQAARVTGKHPLKAETLLNRKLGILNVTGVMGLAPELVFPLYVAASADSQEPVIKRGEELLKKVASAVNLDDLRLIRRLFLLFNGTRGVENVAPESIVSPGSISLRVKLMSVLCRSIAAANSFPSTLQCVFGCIYGSDSTSRLKQLGMEFTVWVFKHARIDQLQLMGPLILNGIVKSLDGSLNSEPDGISRDTKIFAFQAIGLLALRMPVFFRDKIDMAVRLFDALKSEPQSLRFIIQESTNSLANAYKDAPATVLKDVEQLLLRNSQVEQSEARSCAVRWAISLYDRHHCPSRFICMLGVADSKLDIREMALEGLFSKNEEHSISQNVDFKYPRLGDMLNYIVKQQPKLLDSGNLQDQQLLFPSNIYIVMIKFLLKCFEAELQQDNSLRSAIENPSSVQTMYLLLEHAMAFEGSVELHGTASKALMMIGAHLPEMTASRYVTRISFLKQFLGHLDHDTRDSVARLLGIASSALPTSESCALITELIISIDGRQKLRFEMLHGTLSAIGYMTAELMTRIPGIPDILMNTIHFLVDFVISEATTLASVAMQALGHIALRVPLPPLDSVPALLALQGKLCKLLSGDDIRAIQKIVISLGHISVKETSSSQLKIVLDLIFNLARSKVEDILFATGEALAFLWGGIPVTADMILKTNYTSLAMQSNFLLGDVSSSLTRYCNSNGENEADDDGHVMVRDAITEKLFNGLLYSTRKDERCAGTVWLLSLTLYCSRHPAIQKMLPDIQEAFSHLLGEQSELIQDLASQGMSIVYEIGDESMKQNLVNALVSTLTGSGKRKRAIKLVEDSEVFQEGAIGDSLGGGKLSTYKELCNLANEMGQPDLIYKFMDLANYQASMNSKRGAAFGFSKIAKQAGDALQPHLKSLVPRLVRYQYDPDKNVQDAMTHIWKSLVANSKKTIDENLDIIFDDLLIQCGSRLWRSREASCLALADIIQGRKFDQVCKHLEKIWKATFRAMDDIKETVRKAGDNLCRALTSLTIRLCDVSLTNAPDASSSMDIVLPLLLTQGILSKVDNIRVASTGIVMKLTKGAGIAIRPHLSDLVCCMLESLSSLEDQGLNYVELHAENVGIQTDKLENLRISVAKSSPMWDTLDECIKVVDAQTLDSLVPRLAQLVRSGVGLNTRVGVASFLSLLVQKVGVDVKPFTGMLLRLLFPVVKEEKSIAAKRAFANACSSVLKHASTSQAQKLIEDTTALHNGDKKCQVSCAILLKSFSSMAPDVMTGYHAAVVPVIFISRFEDDKYVSSQFEELWEETTSGERITLHLYLGEIVSLICECINSSSWANKKKSAQAIVKLCDVLDKSMSSYHHILLKSLMKELNGRLWEGKEVFLHAIGAISMSCHEAISKDDPALPNTILDVVSSACTKKDKKFREASFSCLQKVLKGFGSPMFFGMVFPLFLDMINSATLFKPVQASLATDKTKAESDDVEDLSPLGDRILSCMEACIHVAHVDDILSQRGDLVDVCLGSLSPGLRWTVKMSAFSLIKELCLALQKAMDDPQKASLHASAASLACELFHSVSPQVLETLSTVKIAQVHIAASECLLEMTKLYRALPTEYWKDIEFKDELLRHYEAEKNEQAKSLLRNCTEVLETLILEESAQSG